MTARLLIAAGLAGVIALWMWSGTVVVSGSADEAATPPPAARQAADDELFRVRVRTFTAQERPRTLTMPGRTHADALVSVAAETQGRIAERPVDRGTSVSTGDILCRLDQGVREAERVKAEAEAAKARLEHEAAKKLQGRGFESQTRVAATKAALDAAEAAVAAAEQELERTIVRAPIAGVVHEPMAEPGSVLMIGGLCATIVDADPIRVTGEVSERDVAKLDTGMPASIDLVTGETVEGEISFVSRTGSEQTRTFTVEILVENPDLALRAGVTAEATIPLDPVTAHRLSPGVLTLSDAGVVGVRTVDANGVVSFRPVDMVQQGTDGVWVAGLPRTVTIITVGQDYVKEGQTVIPVHEDGAARAEAEQGA